MCNKRQRTDSVAVGDDRYSSEGYFYDSPILTRTGIFPYHLEDGTIRRELRRPEDVFDPDSLASYEGKPVIITHDARSVDTDNAVSYTHLDVYKRQIRRLVQSANACGVRVHGLGYTKKDAADFGFYSVDSTTWTTQVNFGGLSYFNGSEMVAVRPPKGMIGIDYRIRREYSLKEWLKYQKYLDTKGKWRE